jgi:hypothetical protein
MSLPENWSTEKPFKNIRQCVTSHKESCACTRTVFEDIITDIRETSHTSLKPLIHKEAKLSPYKAAEAYRVVKRRGFHTVQTIGSQLTARYWLLVAVHTVQFVPHRKHTPSP